MTATHAVICAGRLYADLVFTDLPRMPTLGTETFAGALGIHPGGGAAITAAHLAALGCSAQLLTTLPAAPFADVILPMIAAHGIDIALCNPAPISVDPQITVAMAHQGDRAFLTRRDGTATPTPALAALKAGGARHLHIGELATLAEQPDLVTLARRAGMTVSLDCSGDETLFRPDMADLIGAVDLFFPNRTEYDALLQAGLSTPLAPIAVIKNGANGAETITPDGHWHEPANSVAAADTTGAGDAFNAGYLAAWLSGEDPATCLRSGHRAGAVAVSGPGGFGGLNPGKS